MAIDRAFDPSRQPRLPERKDVREAQKAGKITRDEALGLGARGLARGPYDNESGKPYKSEGEIARRVHKNAGLQEGDW